MYKQLIIARKDLNMSPGKLAAQVSHASIAFLIEKLYWGSKEVVRERDGLMYHIGIAIDRSLFHNWIAEAETKVVCRAKNKNDLLRAKELGWEENKDYWLIYDACRTELEREGPKGTLTANNIINLLIILAVRSSLKDRDKKKDEYCLNHNIKLQRISYQDYDKINLDMLLS